MLIEKNSIYLLKKTRAKAKMYEYSIPEEQHVFVEDNVPDLLLIAIGAIGNISAAIIKNPDANEKIIKESKSELEFSSKFFDSFLNSKFDDESSEYYILLGSVAYFLCDYLGSSKVLANKVNLESLDLNARGIEKILACLLKDCFNNYSQYNIDNQENPYQDYIDRLTYVICEFFESGEITDLSIIKDFRKIVYDIGTPIELLLIDALLAIFLLKINHSAHRLLPEYTGIDSAIWKPIVLGSSFVKELWPAQRHLGQAGVFAGKSAVIQMPTSSGKTKSISIALRSAFLSGRTSFAVIVAPFRALCREIRLDIESDFKYDQKVYIDEMSDVLQVDSLVFDTYKEDEKLILVLTPEKLIYLLRQRTELINKIGVIVFDEGHLFDDSHRGATYELLVSTIKGYINDTAQKILVSAVIPNAENLNGWLNGTDGVVIADNTIKSTEKAIAITDWESSAGKQYGYLYFLNPEDPDEEEFYVPRLINIQPLNKFSKKEKQRFFPEVSFEKLKVENNDIAIFYALNLCINGGVAIFCGRKDTADKILSRILEIEQRGYDISKLLNNSDASEVERICTLISGNYGEDNIYYRSAKKAAFVHHAGISNGIKISVEYAIKKGSVKCLVCTSTLAQGVNLPIRYLVVSSIYQAKERIKVRDFHNLIGRSGRSGIYTEGNVLFSESFVYSRKNNRFENWKWNGYKELLNVSNSEECTSILLSLVRPVPISKEYTFEFKEIIDLYYNNPYEYDDEFNTLKADLKTNHPSLYDDFIEKYNQLRICLDSVESFILQFLLEDTFDKCQDTIKSVLENTFAYYLANEEEKQNLYHIFELISNYIINIEPDSNRRYSFSKTLLGVRDTLEIETWVLDNVDGIIECNSVEDLFSIIVPILPRFSNNKVLKGIDNIEYIEKLGQVWIGGKTYFEITTYAEQQNIQITSRNKLRNLVLEDIINLCDDGFGYACTLIISAITEMLTMNANEIDLVVDKLNQLGKRLRYGLNTRQSIMLFEVGFSDRVVAIEMGEILEANSIRVRTKQQLKEQLVNHQELFRTALYKYPSVFMNRFELMIS